jgi:hypothetical protein
MCRVKGLRHKSLQTTEIYLQAIDPSFRETTMRLLEGNVMGFLGNQITGEETYSQATHDLLINLPQKERVQGFEP